VSLRKGCIGAVASKIECGPAGYCKFCAERALDAILDYLEANADEWDEAALAIAQSDSPAYSLPGNFITALRIKENQP
jgi:hypothetical protein